MSGNKHQYHQSGYFSATKKKASGIKSINIPELRAFIKIQQDESKKSTLQSLGHDAMNGVGMLINQLRTTNTDNSFPFSEKEDTSFKQFLKDSPAKTLLDYYSNHWDRIMGKHYETPVYDLYNWMLHDFRSEHTPDVDQWNVGKDHTFYSGIDCLIFPRIARKLLIDVTCDMLNDIKNKNDKFDSKMVVNSIKLIAWGLLEFMRHVIGLVVMTAVVLATPILLLADHDLVSNDYNHPKAESILESMNPFKNT